MWTAAARARAAAAAAAAALRPTPGARWAHRGRHVLQRPAGALSSACKGAGRAPLTCWLLPPPGSPAGTSQGPDELRDCASVAAASEERENGTLGLAGERRAVCSSSSRSEAAGAASVGFAPKLARQGRCSRQTTGALAENRVRFRLLSIAQHRLCIAARAISSPAGHTACSKCSNRRPELRASPSHGVLPAGWARLPEPQQRSPGRPRRRGAPAACRHLPPPAAAACRLLSPPPRLLTLTRAGRPDGAA